MEHLTASTSPIPFSGEDWFDPLEDAIRLRIRAFIEAMVEEEAQAALGGRKRYQRNGQPKGYRNGHRRRRLAGTNTRRVRRALAGLFGGKVGKDAVSRAWRKVKTDWESWQARDLSGEDIVRPSPLRASAWMAPASRRALTGG